MENPETQATLGTEHRKKTKKTKKPTQKTKNISYTDPTKKGMNPGAREGKVFLCLIRHPLYLEEKKTTQIVDIYNWNIYSGHTKIGVNPGAHEGKGRFSCSL